MKNIKIIQYFLVILITFSACDDFVDVDPIGVEAEDYFNSEEEYESALLGAYDLLGYISECFNKCSCFG